MANEFETNNLAHIQTLAEKGAFQYGATNARLINAGQSDSPRKNAARAVRIGEALMFHPGIEIETTGDKKEDERRRGEVIRRIDVISHENGNSYTAINLNGRPFFVDIRNPLNEKDIKENLGAADPDISIVSGPCLFSAETARGITYDGRPIPITTPGVEIDAPISKLDISPNLSLYEVESVARLSSFINGLLHLNSNIKNLDLNIPDVEYYLYMLQAHRNGFISSEQTLEWFSQVDERHNRLLRHMSRKSLQGIPNEREVTVTDSMPLAAIQPYIVESVRTGEYPTVFEAEGLLSNDPLWEQIIQAEKQIRIGKGEETRLNWIDINRLSYVYAELKAGQNEPGAKSKPNVAIVVENPSESKIFAHAKTISRLLPSRDSFQVVAMYPHEAILPREMSRTMYHVPGQRIDFSTAKTIFRVYNGKTENQTA